MPETCFRGGLFAFALREAAPALLCFAAAKNAAHAVTLVFAAVY